MSEHDELAALRAERDALKAVLNNAISKLYDISNDSDIVDGWKAFGTFWDWLEEQLQKEEVTK